jgi:hypothetical protein
LTNPEPEWFPALTHTAGVEAKDYYLVPRAEIQGEDLLCGQKDYQGSSYPYCRICSGVRAVADACSSNPECVAFSMEGDYCGYLKKSTKTAYREEYNAYITKDAPSGRWGILELNGGNRIATGQSSFKLLVSAT